MKYDSSKDEAVFSETIEFEKDRITVAVFKYSGGEPKVQITREKKYVKTGWRFHKLGRMTLEESIKVLELLKKAIA